MHAQTIERCFETVVARVGDPREQVYAKLFERAPELRHLFVLDHDGAVRAEMLHRAIDTVTDLFGDGHYARGLIATEWVNHQNVGVPSTQFEWLFVSMIDAFRDILGADWGNAEQQAWDEVLRRIRVITGALPPS